MENIKIWHTPDEMKPVDNTDIVVLGPMGFDGFRFYITEDRKGRYHYENWIKWAYLDDVINSLEATSKALEELDAEYNEFICSTWVEYADEPDEKLASDARKLRDRMRRLMNQQILSERDQYKKALDVARKFYLQKCEQLGALACPSEDDEKLINEYAHRFRKLGQAELDKVINHIMKGNK